MLDWPPELRAMPKDAEIQRVRSGRVPGAGASVPADLGCVTLLAHGHVHQAGSSPNPIRVGLSWRLHGGRIRY